MRCAPSGAIYPNCAQRESRAALKRLVDEEQWPWAQEQAGALMRHFSDLRPIERLGEAADLSLSHSAVELEQLLRDIAALETERQAKR
jgi:hypothetical protein